MVQGSRSYNCGHGPRGGGHGPRVVGHGPRGGGHGSRVVGHGTRDGPIVVVNNPDALRSDSGRVLGHSVGERVVVVVVLCVVVATVEVGTFVQTWW